MGDINKILEYIKQKYVNLNVRKTKIENEFEVKFVKAYIAFKMGVVKPIDSDEMIHKNGDSQIKDVNEIKDDTIRKLMIKYSIINLSFLF